MFAVVVREKTSKVSFRGASRADQPPKEVDLDATFVCSECEERLPLAESCQGRCLVCTESLGRKPEEMTIAAHWIDDWGRTATEHVCYSQDVWY